MDKLSKKDLQAIRAIVRREMRRSSFSKAWSLVKILMLLTMAAAALLGMAVALDKLMSGSPQKSEDIDEIREQ